VAWTVLLEEVKVLALAAAFFWDCCTLSFAAFGLAVEGFLDVDAAIEVI
jgi:hypothetical protein